LKCDPSDYLGMKKTIKPSVRIAGILTKITKQVPPKYKSCIITKYYGKKAEICAFCQSTYIKMKIIEK
jgi:hypothetical protein